MRIFLYKNNKAQNHQQNLGYHYKQEYESQDFLRWISQSNRQVNYGGYWAFHQ